MPGALLNVAWSPAIRDTFGLPLHAVGTLLLASTAGYVGASWISGHLTARGRLGRLLAVSTLVSGLGMLASALAPSWIVLVLAGLVVGIGGGLLDGAMNIYFAASFGPRLMNWLHASFGVGATLAPLAMTAILESGGSWRVGDALAALLFGVVASLFAATESRWQLAPAGLSAARQPVAVAGETLRLPAVWLGIGVFLICTGMEVSAGQWSFSLLTESRHLPGSIAGLCVSGYWGSFTAGRILFGLVADRVPPAALIRRCMVGMAIGAVLLGWRDLGRGAAAGLLLFGVSLAPIFALMMTRTQERLGPTHAPNAIGFQVAAAGVGAGTLPGLAGVLAKTVGLEIIPGFLLAATVLMLVLFEANQREADTPPR
jgi:fucose permease